MHMLFVLHAVFFVMITLQMVPSDIDQMISGFINSDSVLPSENDKDINSESNDNSNNEDFIHFKSQENPLMANYDNNDSCDILAHSNSLPSLNLPIISPSIPLVNTSNYPEEKDKAVIPENIPLPQDEEYYSLSQLVKLTQSENKINLIETFKDYINFKVNFVYCRNEYCKRQMLETDGVCICRLCTDYFKRTKLLRGKKDLKRHSIMIEFKDYMKKADSITCCNLYCNAILLVERDGKNICRLCINHYKRTGKLRGKDKLIEKKREKRKEKKVQKKGNKKESLSRPKNTKSSLPAIQHHNHSDTENKSNQEMMTTPLPLTNKFENTSLPQESDHCSIFLNDKDRLIASLNSEKSQLKIQMIKEFSNDLNFDLNHVNCRNNYCLDEIKKRDGKHFCRSCFRYYKKNWKLKGKEEY